MCIVTAVSPTETPIALQGKSFHNGDPHSTASFISQRRQTDLPFCASLPQRQQMCVGLSLRRQQWK